MGWQEDMTGFRPAQREDIVDGQEYKREYHVEDLEGHKAIITGAKEELYPLYCGLPCDFTHVLEGMPATWCVCYSPVLPPKTCSSIPGAGNQCFESEDETGCISWKMTACDEGSGKCWWKFHKIVYVGSTAACYCVYQFVYDNCGAGL